jgi:hypothetical protein
MCEKCVELDSKIEHYQRMASKISDQATLDGIKELVERMKAINRALCAAGIVGAESHLRNVVYRKQGCKLFKGECRRFCHDLSMDCFINPAWSVLLGPRQRCLGWRPAS